MLENRFSRVAVAAAILSLLGVAAWGQAQQQKSPWKDRAEYDLYNAMLKEQDPTKKVQQLDTYLEKYPETKFKENCLLLYVMAYQSLKQGDKMYDAALELLKLNPKNFQGMYYITQLTVTSANTSADRLANGDKYARALLAHIPTMKKPDTVSAANWKKSLDDLKLTGETALAWVALTRKNNTEAEKRYRNVLGLKPSNAQASYYLASVILAQRDPAKQSEAFYHFARAGNLGGEGAMPASGRQQVSDYLKKIYVSYHGSEEGLDELIATSLKSAKAPAGFHIKDKATIEAEADQKLAREQPELYRWLKIKEQLTATDGEGYFASSMKNTRVQGLRGYLVSQTPAERPKTLVVALSDKSSREVTIVLDTPYKYAARRGTALRFEGVPTSFRKQPFMLTLNVEQAKLRGWPAAPARRQTR
ncbi:MAG: hypothetical protein GY953_49780 [bacterium]|nr:hypothetical protein [bacterium]